MPQNQELETAGSETVQTLPPEHASDDALRAAVLESTGEAILAVDRAGRILTWNDAASELYGLSARQVTGTRVVDLIPEGPLRVQARRLIEDVVAGTGWQGEILIPDRSGRTIPVLATITPLQDDLGRIIGGVCVARDASEHRAAEEALRQSEKRIDLVRAAADSVIWEMDLRTGAVRWSDAITSTFGYPAEEVEPTEEWWLGRIHPDDRGRVEERVREVLQEGARFWTEEYRFRRYDGGYALVFDRAHVARDEDGLPVGAVGAMVDLTERRRLAEGQRFLSQASMLLDLSLDYETTLPTIARLATTTLADFCFVRVDAGDGFPGFAAASHSDPRLQPLADDIVGFIEATQIESAILARVRNAGEPLLFSRLPEDAAERLGFDDRASEVVRELGARTAVAVPLRAKQDLVGLLIAARTAETEPYDDADVRLLEELGRRIGLAVDHARLFQAAQLANRAKSDFLAVISHELRTPLTAVLGYADLLTAEVAGPLNARQQHQVDRIRAGSDRLLQLIEGILAFARLETGAERARPDRVELKAVLDQLTDVVGPRVREDGSTLQVDADGAPEVVITDGEKVLQILLALLLNAMKFTRRGAISVRVRGDGDRLTFDVSDSGSGIAPEHLPYIFNPFWQAEQPATRRAGGAGLGLSVAKRTARLLGGDVTVIESSPVGTTFRLDIPANGVR